MAEKYDTNKFVQLFLKGYVPKSKDEDKFAKKHVAKRDDDRNGNGDDVFQATNIPEYDRTKGRHGYKSGDDAKVYEAALTPAEMKHREKIVRAMKRSGDFGKRYGKDAKSIMYATATKLANEGYTIAEEHEEEAVIDSDTAFGIVVEIEEAKKQHRDPMSQPVAPNATEAEGDRKKKFADKSVVEQLLQQMEQEIIEVTFDDGSFTLIDNDVGKSIINVYLDLDEETRAVFEGTISEGIDGFESGLNLMVESQDDDGEQLDEKYDKYIATSEKSKMSDGHRAKLLAPEGHVSYLSQKAYKTPKHARDAASYYHELNNQRLHYAAMDRKMGEYNKAYDKKHGIVKEDVEQIDEVGDKTLARYIDKAVVDAHNDAKWSGESGDRKSGNKAFKRVLGIKSAAARLGKTGLPHGGIHQYRSYKEEVEVEAVEVIELDESDYKGNFKVRGQYKDKDGNQAGITHIIRFVKDAEHAKRIASEKVGKNYAGYKALRATPITEEQMLDEANNPYSLYDEHPKFKAAHQVIDLAVQHAKTDPAAVGKAMKKYQDVGASDSESRDMIYYRIKKLHGTDVADATKILEEVEQVDEISTDLAKRVIQKRETRSRSADLRGDIETGHEEIKKAANVKRMLDKKVDEAVEDDLSPSRNKAPKRDTGDLATVPDKHFPGRHHVFWKGKKLNVRISNEDAGVWVGRGRGSNRGNQHYVEYYDKDNNTTHKSRRIGSLSMAKDHIYDLMMKKEAMKEDVELVSEIDKAKYVKAAVADISVDANYQGWKYGTKHPKDPINRSDDSSREEKRRKGIDLALRLMQRGKK